MQTLNGIIDQIYCINLDRRTDRWGEASELFSALNIDVKRVSAIENRENPGCGLRETNISIFRDAIENSHEKILIFEDDVLVDTETFYKNFESSWESLPADWDMFYFSAAHQYWPNIVNDLLFKLSWSTSAHAIVFRKKSFEKILQELENSTEISDVIYAKLQPKLNAYCCINPIAWQRKSFSDIEGEEKWYPYLKDIDFYDKYSKGLVTIDGKEIQSRS